MLGTCYTGGHYLLGGVVGNPFISHFSSFTIMNEGHFSECKKCGGVDENQTFSNNII